MAEFIKNKVKEMIPTRLILDYFQHWGQTIEVKIKALKDAANEAGLEVEILFIENENKIGVECLNERSRELWPKFYDEINACWPLGHFEDEEGAVRKVIEKYQKLTGVKS